MQQRVSPPNQGVKTPALLGSRRVSLSVAAILTPGAAGIPPGAAADGICGTATGAEAVVELASTCTVRCGAAPPDPDPEDPGLFFES